MILFFHSPARKSRHSFPDLVTESKTVINNFNPVYYGTPSFRSDYFFNYTTKCIDKDLPAVEFNG